MPNETPLYDGALTREALLTDAPDGLYRVVGAEPRVESMYYDATTDSFSERTVVTVARVRTGAGQLPATGECYQEGDRQVLFMDVPVDPR